MGLRGSATLTESFGQISQVELGRFIPLYEPNPVQASTHLVAQLENPDNQVVKIAAIAGAAHLDTVETPVRTDTAEAVMTADPLCDRRSGPVEEGQSHLAISDLPIGLQLDVLDRVLHHFGDRSDQATLSVSQRDPMSTVVDLLYPKVILPL